VALCLLWEANTVVMLWTSCVTVVLMVFVVVRAGEVGTVTDCWLAGIDGGGDSSAVDEAAVAELVTG